MIRFVLALALLSAAPVLAQETASSTMQTTDAEPDPMTALDRWRAAPTTVFDAAEISLDDFMWEARPIVVFADSPNDPNFRRQMQLIENRPEDLAERDVLVVTDTDPSAESDIRQRLRPRGFMLALIGKDGQVKLRKPLPWDVRELSRSIDKMPLRQQEIDDRR
ncbi:DUF4174 domain-containing protein [Histidinibacterium aquaticum]|uniref:DUF4174 domain-containing protein n=1 Tax=Histidinibacterium aquaticum TaxID=2613962 RepID=A0A5J5GQT4_9RHOB|nr:DUF4174 domain-containing protein [Histidinibacterium aquaticum]KAA9009918.1 DUF4174 domain-containing protein [Histidinibacterium aquaticum]